MQGARECTCAAQFFLIYMRLPRKRRARKTRAGNATEDAKLVENLFGVAGGSSHSPKSPASSNLGSATKEERLDHTWPHRNDMRKCCQLLQMKFKVASRSFDAPLRTS
eukprot:3080226-Pyramimonas_sp.AAC.1